MSLLLPGMHVAATSVMHRLDPRVKMVSAMLLIALPFAAPSVPSYVILSVFVTVTARLSGVPLAALLRTLRTVLWIGVFMFVFYLFTTPGEPMVAFGGISVTWAGIVAASTQVYRLCLLVIIASLLTYTTSPTQLAHGFEALLNPLSRVRLPVRELSMVLTIALRFVPTLTQEIEKIVKAQQARGVDFGGNVLGRIRSWVPVFVPIFVSAFRRAEQLALAMEARGYRGAEHRTRLYRLQLTPQDILASLIVLAVGLLSLGVARLKILGGV